MAQEQVKLIGMVGGHLVGDEAHMPLYKRPALDVYSGSRLFDKAASYSAHMLDDYYILSAMYGLVRPQQMITPYDRNFYYLTQRERIVWRELVRQQVAGTILDPGCESNTRYVLWWLCGRVYIDLLAHMWPLERQQTPLEGLKLAEMMGWFTQHGF